MMIKKDAKIEEQICKVYDFIADENDAQARALAQNLIEQIKIKTRVEYTDDNFGEQAGYFLQWGRCLELLDEPEQAMLKWERSLHFDADSIETLWALSSCLIYTMNKPEAAIPIIREKLLALDPENEQFQDALRISELGAGAAQEAPDFMNFMSQEPKE